jgi:putative FmdB family regulatory protein
MSIYEFKCDLCGCVVWINYESDKRDTPTECPDCKGLMRRSYQLGGVSFKGTGWGKD